MKIPSAKVAMSAATTQQKQIKPHTEAWNVGQDTFDSTADLVAAADRLDGKEAVYRFTTEPDSAPYSRGEKAMNVVGGALAGTIPGAVGGALLGTGLTLVVGGIQLLEQAAFYGPGADPSLALLWVPTLAGTAIGAVVGGKEGGRLGAEAAVQKIPGTLRIEGERLAFYPNNKIDQRVDLNTYQNAEEAPLVFPEPKPQNAIWNATRGAAIGAALVPAQLIPLVGVAAPTYLGAKVGEILDDRTALGTGLGAVAGAALTIGGIALANNRAIPQGKLALAFMGGLGLVGAALGHTVFSRQAEQEAAPYHDFGQQWWN